MLKPVPRTHLSRVLRCVISRPLTSHPLVTDAAPSKFSPRSFHLLNPGKSPSASVRYLSTTPSAKNLSGILNSTLSSQSDARGISEMEPSVEFVSHAASENRAYAAVVVGAGPAGITVVSQLVEQKRLPILWVDPQFKVGRMGTKYREVPSNTRVKVLLETANSTSINKEIIEKSTAPNAITVLKEMDQFKGCDLTYAVDMLDMFQNEFICLDYVDQCYGVVKNASWNDEFSHWSISIPSQPPVTSSILVLCTGSHPRTVTSILPLPADSPPTTIDLDVALSPTLLSAHLDPITSSFSTSSAPRDGHSAPLTIGVIGTSHSAILVLMNLHRLLPSLAAKAAPASSGASSPPPLRVRWFVRHPLRYAEHMPAGWTLRDNTGLKGLAADFARENLEPTPAALGRHARWLTKVDLPADDAARETAIYAEQLRGCTHLVQAVGYRANELPALSLQGSGRRLAPVFDHRTGGFAETEGGSNKKKIKGLYGAGIAFPELVTDPLGNQEMNVGIWKFVTFVKRVSPEWT